MESAPIYMNWCRNMKDGWLIGYSQLQTTSSGDLNHYTLIQPLSLNHSIHRCSFIMRKSHTIVYFVI